MQPRQAALSSAVSRLLVQNNEAEELAAGRALRKFTGGCRGNFIIFLAAILLAIVLTSLYLIRNNRRLFAQVEELSSQRSDLAQKLIATQESTLRHISRELHDEFGQVLTAIGSLLRRTDKQIPADSPLHADLQEVREIAQNTLNNIRSLSQALHPVLLDEAGLETHAGLVHPDGGKTDVGLCCTTRSPAERFPVGTRAGVQIYRVLQEALNNVSRHSGAKEAWIRLRFAAGGVGTGSGGSRKRTGASGRTDGNRAGGDAGAGGTIGRNGFGEALGTASTGNGTGTLVRLRDSARQGGDAWRIS